jgi:hypothetical protein
MLPVAQTQQFSKVKPIVSNNAIMITLESIDCLIQSVQLHLK